MILSGAPNREITEKFPDTTNSSLYRHKSHIGEAIVKAGERREVSASNDLIGQLGELIETTKRALNRAEESGDDRLLLTAVKEARGNIETLAKIQIALVEQAKKTGRQEKREIIHKVVYMTADQLPGGQG